MARFECPNCGADLRFDAKKQGMKCDYCGSDHPLKHEPVGKSLEEKDLDLRLTEVPVDPERTRLKCEDCGATMQTGLSTAGACPFCGSNYVKELKEHIKVVRPWGLITFKVDPDKAGDLFKRWIGKGWFRPNDLKKLNSRGLLKGVYIPFWTFDCDTFSEWTAMSGYHYYVTEHYTTHENGRTVHRTRQVQKTRWVPSSGSRSDSFDDILVLASTGVDRGITKDIEPFDLNGTMSYKGEYLAGWMSEEYSIPVKQGWETANGIVRQETHRRCGSDVPGDTYMSLKVKTDISDRTYKHILLPIWISSYQYHNKTYRFLINGQTGECQGEKPWSWIKIALAILGGLAAIGIAAGLIYAFA